MKIKFDSFEVEIKAKGVYETDKFNEQDTMALLNIISLIYHESALWNLSQGAQSTAKQYEAISDDIYNVLKEKGLYD